MEKINTNENKFISQIVLPTPIFRAPIEIYSQIYGTSDISAMEILLKTIAINKGICGKKLIRNQLAWRCPVCGKEENSILCDECHQASNHVGHKAIKICVGGGNCDCGDPDVWDTKGSCPKHAGGYIDETQLTVDLLPKSMQESAKSGMDAVLSRLNYCCLLLDETLQNGTKSEEIAALEWVLKEEIKIILESLGHLAKDVCPVFLHMIASRLRLYSVDFSTRHRCNVRRFDTDAEEKRFNLLCEEKEIKFEVNRIPGIIHKCTCTALENLMRIIHAYDRQTVEILTASFFDPLLANRRLKFYMALSYFANYRYLMPYCSIRTGPLVALAIQFIGYEDIIKSVVECPEYLQEISNEFDRIITSLSDNVVLRKPVIRHELSFLSYDVSTLLQERHIHAYLPFILGFVRKLYNLQQFEIYSKNNKEQNALFAIGEICTIFEKIFLTSLVSVDFTDTSMCKQIASAFKECILDKQFPLEKDSGVFIVTLYKCLSAFLTNYLLYQYWAHPDPGLIKESFMFLFEFKNEAELALFIDNSLSRLFAFMGTLTELILGEWADQGIPPKSKAPSYHYEFSLTAILLLFTNQTNLLQWIIEKMHRRDPNVFACFKAVCEKTGIDSFYAEGSYRTKEKLQQILEQTLHCITCIISNDTMYSAPISIFRKWREARKLSNEKAKIYAINYIEYFTTKQIVNTFIQKSDRGGVNYADIQEGFPDSLRDRNKIEKCLEAISEPFFDTVNRVMKFKLFDDSLKLYDPFTYYVKLVQAEEVDHSIKIMNRIRDPVKYDYFFSELAKDEKCLPQIPSGEPYTPFRLLLRRKIALTDTISLLSNFICTDMEFVTPWMLRCAYKLLIACIPYHSEEPILKKILAKNIQKLIYDESMSDIAEKYKTALCPDITKIMQQELEEDKSESIPQMTRKLSAIEKQKVSDIKMKIMEEFKGKVTAFVSKNSTVLSETKYADIAKVSYVCGYCREILNQENYSKNMYGKIVYIHKSKVFGLHLNQILSKAKHKTWGNNVKLGCIPGVTMGLVLTSCGHYLHEKCWRVILEKPPGNAVSNIDTQYEPKTFLCPLCKMCGNNILTPFEIIEKGDPMAIKQIKEGLLSEMRIISDSFMQEEPTGDERFKLICNYITYQFHLIDISNVADFTIKQDCIHSLVYCLKSIIEPNLYDEMMQIKEEIMKHIGFLYKNLHELFEADLLSIFTQLIVAAKLIESKERQEKILSELNDKLQDIIRLAIIQILLAITCANFKGEISIESLSLSLKESSVAALLKNHKRIQKRLLPFLKKILCMKIVLFPNPGSDVILDIAKVGWLSKTETKSKQIEQIPEEDEARVLEFYLKELNISKDIICSLLTEPEIPTKEVFLRMPDINRKWMLTCFDSLIKSLLNDPKTSILNEKRWPLLVLFKSGNKKFNLIQLPADFDDLLAFYADRQCKDCMKISRDCALCLLCGHTLCVGKGCERKNEKGELSNHSKECCSGCGLFLRLMNNKVIMIDNAQACMYTSPYVNKYGESVDISKSQEKEKLSLEIRIVEELKTMYLLHSIPQTTRVIALKSFVKFKPYTL